MKILALLLADKAEMSAENKLNIEGIFNSINASAFPAQHLEFMVVVVTEGGEGEQEHRILIKKEDQVVRKIEERLTLSKRTYGLFRFENVVFSEAGRYVVELEIGTNKISTDLFLVQV